VPKKIELDLKLLRLMQQEQQPARYSGPHERARLVSHCKERFGIESCQFVHNVNANANQTYLILQRHVFSEKRPVCMKALKLVFPVRNMRLPCRWALIPASGFSWSPLCMFVLALSTGAAIYTWLERSFPEAPSSSTILLSARGLQWKYPAYY
jgi:hypothetical protein